LGIEVEVMQAIHENDRRHKVTSCRKRKFLLDAIEDIAAVSPEYRAPLLAALARSENQIETRPSFFRTEIRSDVSPMNPTLRAQEDHNAALSQRLSELRREIQDTESQTAHMKVDVEAMKEKLRTQSDLLFHSCQLHTQMREINEQFREIFARQRDKIPSHAVQELIDDNEQMYKILDQKKSELELACQISRKLMFLEANKNRF
jgi:small-conductance mechanosensitive channel